MKKIMFVLMLITLCSFVTAEYNLTNLDCYYSSDNADTVGVTATDTAGANDGTLKNGVTTGNAGVINEQYDYDGVNQYLNTTCDLSDGDFSICAWYAPGSDQDAMFMWRTSAALSFPILGAHGIGCLNDKYCFGLNDGAWNVAVSTTSFSTDGTEQFVCMVLDDGVNIKIYVDSILEDTTVIGAVGAMGTLDFASNQVGGANLDSEIDEIAVYSRALDLADIQDGYNGGAGKNPTATATANLATTLDYPINGTHYHYYDANLSKIYTGDINLTTNIAANCTPNNSTWAIIDTGNISHNFLNNTPIVSILPGNYSLNITCNNVVNTTETLLWFVIDETNATINVTTPLNNSLQFQNFNLNVSYFDTYLFRTNTTLRRDSDSVIVFSNYSGDLSGVDLYYNLSQLINISNGSFTTGNYTLIMEASDTHTNNKYFEGINVKTKKTKISNNNIMEFEFKDKKVKIHTPGKLDINYKQKSDRLTLSFESDTIRGETYKIIEAEHSIIYLPDSSYKGHFILDGSLWYDCEGLDVTKVERLTDIQYKISYNQNKDIEESHSLGGLNEINQTITFAIGHTNINITVFDVTTLNIINQNVSIDITFGANPPVNYGAENGTLLLNSTDNGSVTIDASTVNYNAISIPATILPGITNDIELYMTNSSLTGATIIEVIDSNSQPVQNATVRIFHLVGGNWTLETELPTNFEGETIYQFIRDTDEYKFDVYVDGELIEETGSTLIFKSRLTIQVALTTDELLSIKYSLDAITTLTYANVSGLATYTYTWAGGDLKGARLRTWQRVLTSNDVLIAENTSNASFGSMTVKFTQQPGVLYTTQGFIDTNTTSSWFLDKAHELKLTDAKDIFGATGLMAAFLIVGVLSFLFIRTHPALAIFVNIIALLGATFFGFIAGLTYSWVILVAGVGVLIAFTQKT